MRSTIRCMIRDRRPRKGAILLLVALLLIIFIGMVAFMVDVAFMQLVQTQLRIAVDAAARASGESLSRTQDLDLARAAAKSLASQNLVAGEALILDDSDIIAGKVTQQENGKWTFDSAGTPVNGLQVTGRRTDGSPCGPVPLYFAQIFQSYQFETSKSAVVVRLDRDICLVVDRSSSMKLTVENTAPYMSGSDPRMCLPPLPDSRWQALEDAGAVFSSTLASTETVEYVALVSYASNGTWCALSNTSSNVDLDLTSDLTALDTSLTSIGNTIFNGGTEISSGIDTAVTVLTNSANTRPYAAKTMVVLTDGHQQGGRSPIDAAADAAAAHITVHTITFSNGANQPQMAAVAAAGGGDHYHASDEAALEDVFREIALTLPVMLTE
ncbi:von Willebrand factor type A domain protein [Maioricimonas rarisocia]|uniref:von Willebrand factor type A domain protein n=1 Tax=Maioricimonas rarisocia TaxID=2528026 RepID=A0A517Z911_9PLAN|nr:vWA domain-containing protein [Maioricimonas rarisocia]QDU38972.1 von Willebrand factor type A domain protein [Maioricimonas rarisocia]